MCSPLVARHQLEQAGELPLRGLAQRIVPLGIEAAHPADMRSEMAFVDELGHHRLRDDGTPCSNRLMIARKHVDQRRRRDQKPSRSAGNSDLLNVPT